MLKIFAEIAILLQILAQVLTENKTKEIDALEKEKGELFEQINNAINESVKLLRNNNDSEAILGVNYMTQLQEQLQEINNADFKDSEAPSNDTRRAKSLKMSIFEIANIFQKAKNTKKKEDAKQNKLEMKKKIDEWILQRELEKQKIQAYKERMKLNVEIEKCPRFGIGNKKSKSIKRRNQDGRRKGDKRRKKHKSKKTLPKYPCCRKCCKKSYMGCL